MKNMKKIFCQAGEGGENWKSAVFLFIFCQTRNFLSVFFPSYAKNSSVYVNFHDKLIA